MGRGRGLVRNDEKVKAETEKECKLQVNVLRWCSEPVLVEHHPYVAGPGGVVRGKPQDHRERSSFWMKRKAVG